MRTLLLYAATGTMPGCNKRTVTGKGYPDGTGRDDGTGRRDPTFSPHFVRGIVREP